MSKIELELSSVFGYGLVIFGIILLIYTFIQASMTIGTITSVLSELLPNPILALYTEASTGMLGFAEALTWFFMLLIQTLIGYFIATLGVRKQEESENFNFPFPYLRAPYGLSQS